MILLPQDPSRASALTRDEMRSLTAREALRPDLASFEAGGSVGLAILVLLVVLIVALLWHNPPHAT